MTAIDDVSNWIQNVLKTSKSYSNQFYYDGHGVIRNYEESIDVQKEVIEIVKKEGKITEEIQKKRLEMPTLFKPLYQEINRLETREHRSRLDAAETKLQHDQEILIILKNLVAFSKMFDTIMQELPKTSKLDNAIKEHKRFRLRYEDTLDTLLHVLDKKFKDKDKQNRPLR